MPEPDVAEGDAKTPNHLQLVWMVKRLEDRVEELAGQIVLLEAQPPPAPQVEQRQQDPNEYCICGSLIGAGHYEDANGPCPNDPRSLEGTNNHAAAEIAA